MFSALVGRKVVQCFEHNYPHLNSIIILFLWLKHTGQAMGQVNDPWNGLNAENQSPILGMGLMPDFSSQNWAKVQFFFKVLWAGLTNPRDISDSLLSPPWQNLEIFTPLDPNELSERKLPVRARPDIDGNPVCIKRKGRCNDAWAVLNMAVPRPKCWVDYAGNTQELTMTQMNITWVILGINRHWIKNQKEKTFQFWLYKISRNR